MVWIQLITGKQIDVKGKPKQYHAGAWVNVPNKALAEMWVQSGDARYAIPVSAKVDIPGCGVLVLATDTTTHLAAQTAEALREIDGLEIMTGNTPSLPYPRTLLMAAGTSVQSTYIPVGFGLLDPWQVAAPFCDYDILAKDVGTPEVQERTRAIVRELRVMLFDTRLIFLRRDADTQTLLDVWQRERETGDDDRLCFLRAVYQVKPMILPLPYTWLVLHGKDKYAD